MVLDELRLMRAFHFCSQGRLSSSGSFEEEPLGSRLRLSPRNGSDEPSWVQVRLEVAESNPGTPGWL